MTDGLDSLLSLPSTPGARRANGAGSEGLAVPNPEVVPVANRRRFSSADKQRILDAADRCTKPGEIGALLRREAIYSSLLSTWRGQRRKAERAALAPQRRGPKPEVALADAEFDALVAELVEVQKVAALAGRVLDWVGADSGAVEAAQDGAAEISSSASDDPPGTVAIGDRRQLTVLFSDLVSSTELARSLDSEDLRDLLRAYHNLAAAVVARFHGHIAEYLGDGLLVYFGFPRAGEDDPERAVRAGLAIVAALGELNSQLELDSKPPLAVRVGIHTGPVVVGEVGSGASAEVRAIGATINVAARVQGEASPNGVVVSPATLRLVQGIFLTHDLGARHVKGIGDMHVHEIVRVTGVRSRLDLDPDHRSALVGRDREVGLLVNRWEQVKEGDGKAVLISGEAGGKSRLLRALRERLSDEPHSWLECHCARDRHGSAYYPLTELISHGAGFEADDAPATKLHKLEAMVAFSGLATSEVVPLLASLLALPIADTYPPLHYSPELRHRKTIEALCHWMFALADGQPVLMLVEDLQWCDPSTLDFLSLLLDQSPTAPILTVLSFRPEFQPPWPARSHVLHLEVCRLGLHQAKQLIAGIAAGHALPRDLLERIIARADGVPLFLEELTKMVIESGLSVAGGEATRMTATTIPDTLNDLLMARLDQLGESKQLAQVGAVLGRRFPYDLLHAVSGMTDAELATAMKGLIVAELLYSRGMPPVSTYSFKHALVQDTAYQSLLRSERRRLHAATAKALERHFPDRAESEPEVVARHYDEAGLVDEAIAQYRRAANRAKRRFANQEAIGYLRRALDLVKALSPSAARNQTELALQLAIGTPLYLSHGWANTEYRQSLGRAHELATLLGSSAQLFGVSMGLYFHHQFAGDLAQAENYARRALELAEPTAGIVDHLVALSGLSQSLYLQGHFESALEHIEKLIAIYYSQASEFTSTAPSRIFLTSATAVRPREPSLHLDLPSEGGAASALRGVRALCNWALGYPDQAQALCDAALESARKHDSPFNLASAYIYSGWTHQKRRERRKALIAAQKACDRKPARCSSRSMLGSARASRLRTGWKAAG